MYLLAAPEHGMEKTEDFVEIPEPRSTQQILVD
jgi:hypothetical protein